MELTRGWIAGSVQPARNVDGHWLMLSRLRMPIFARRLIMGRPDDLTRLLGRFDHKTIERMGNVCDGQLGFGGVGAPRTRMLKSQGVGQRHVIFDMDTVTDPCKSLLPSNCKGALKVTAAIEHFEPLSAYWPRTEGYAMNVLTDIGDHAMRSFGFQWFADCGDNDLCSLLLSEQFQRIGGGTVLQRVRGQDFRGAVWVCRDLAAACFGCAMGISQRAEAHRIHSCTRAVDDRAGRTPAALMATQTAAAAHAVQEQWLIQDDPKGRPVNYIVRFDSETGACRIVAMRRDPECPHHVAPVPWDQVHILDKASTQSTRPVDLLNESGSEALLLDRELTQVVACQGCNAQFRLEPPVAEVVLLANQVGCPSCGEDLRSLLTTRRLSRKSDAARETLFDLGMPIGHVYRCESPRSWLAIGDEEDEFRRAQSKALLRTWNLQRVDEAEVSATWMAMT
jgi:hypothetical protein